MAKVSHPERPIPKRCSARSKQSGDQCKRWARPGKNVCVMHGGKSLEGVASPRFIHGKYSKHVPSHLVGRYQEARANPDLLSLTDEIALMEARLTELLDGLAEGGMGAAWDRLRSAQESFQNALASGDTATMITLWRDIAATIQQGANEQDRWYQVQQTMLIRQKLIESERNHLQKMGQMVTVRELTALFAVLVQTLKDTIEDRNVLNGVLHALDKAVFDRSGGRLEDDNGNGSLRLLPAPGQ